MSGQEEAGKPMQREHESMDDFEHLEGPKDDLATGKPGPQEKSAESERMQQHQDLLAEIDAMTQPPRHGGGDMGDPKAASILLLESESGQPMRLEGTATVPESSDTPQDSPLKQPVLQSYDEPLETDDDFNLHETRSTSAHQQPSEADLIQLSAFDDEPPKCELPKKAPEAPEKHDVREQFKSEQYELPQEIIDIRSSVLPVPEASPAIDFLEDAKPNAVDDNAWCVLESKSDAPPTPEETQHEPREVDSKPEKYEMSRDVPYTESPRKSQVSTTDTGDSEFESEPEQSPAIHPKPNLSREPIKHISSASCPLSRAQKIETKAPPVASHGIEDIEIAPKAIFTSMGIDAWFNPERLNPKVAALIYWRDPKKSGIVFGATLGVLLSLAYFSLISVLAYLSLFVLMGTVVFRIYKTVLQAIQKTSDGHPFKDILEVDLKVPAEKVHEVADVAVAHANAAVSELRRLFLVEDFVDSVKFGVLLWCLTYVGSWFNGMTLIIIGVVALFTLPKVYETNKAQIDQNLALVHSKINEITTKVKLAIPLGKKPEPTKEE